MFSKEMKNFVNKKKIITGTKNKKVNEKVHYCKTTEAKLRHRNSYDSVAMSEGVVSITKQNIACTRVQEQTGTCRSCRLIYFG